MLILGIDPGMDGAAALFRADGLVEFFDTPTLTVAGGKGHRRDYDVSEMARRFSLMGDTHAVLESVHAMPGQGVRSMFTMGYGFGLWVGILSALAIPYELVSPQRWKKAMMDGMGKEKDASRVVAMRLFPSVADQLKRKKDHGRADALLIAEWKRRQG